MTDELERLHQVWLRAWLDKDEARVEVMMAHDYLYIAPTGQILDRQAILGIIRSPSYRLDRWTRTEAVTKLIANDVVAVVHRGQGEGAFEGKPFRDDHRCTSLFARRDGDWRIVLEHCSPNIQ